MDFKEIEVYPGMNLSTLFQEVHSTQKDRASQINDLIEKLEEMVQNVGDAVTIGDKLAHLISEGVKNQDILVKLLAIVTKAASNKNKDGKEESTLPQEEIDDLLKAYNFTVKSPEPIKLIDRKDA
jgi:hypothetical protein